MLKTCPNPIDVQDLQFKLHCRLKVFDNKELSSFPNNHSLLCCARRYGLLFIGTNTNSLQVIQIKCIEEYTPKDKDITNYLRRNVTLPSAAKHLNVNCDCTVLAVVVEKDQCPVVIFYSVVSFLSSNIQVIKEVRLSATPGVYIREIGWNPTVPSTFTACKSDGSLGVYELTGNTVDINELPTASGATSFSWSPKGKQIAIGSKNGKITQYKPDLKAVKVINEPPNGPSLLISLQWVSNYQFIGVYLPAEQNGTACVIVVDAPKVGDTVYTNYEDVCYSGTSRSPQFYFILEQQWNLLMVASANSTELGVLGNNNDIWSQWIVADSARAELPLSSDYQETLPVGIALDTSSTKPLAWGESTLPACPYLVILSHQGVLCFFNVVNLKEGVTPICSPPESVADLSGLATFTTKNETLVQTPPSTITENITTTSSNPIIPAFGVQSASVPQSLPQSANNLFQVKQSNEPSLFGNQTVLTPIKPQKITNQPALFGDQISIIPITKSQTTDPVPKTVEKYKGIFSALNTPVTVSSGQTQLLTAQSAYSNIAASPSQNKFQTSVAQKSTPVKSDVPRVKTETDGTIAQMIKEECVALESELKALLHLGRSVKINIGSEEEKNDMTKKLNDLQEFLNEITDICVGQNAEVHHLKQNLIQSWAWYEEARSRYNVSKDKTMILLLRAQPLDSAAEKRLKDIQDTMYHIESQLSQTSKALDEQWDLFQDYAKKRHRIETPTMEKIFQTLLRHSVVLQKQEYILKDIAERLKKKKSSLNSSILLPPKPGIQDDLSDSINNLTLDTHDVFQTQYSKVLNRNKNLTLKKASKLRNMLSNRDVSCVTVVKPHVSLSFLNQSPATKLKQGISIFGAQVSPVAKNVSRNLDFVQSTPICYQKKEVAVTGTPPNTPALPDAQQFLFKNISNTGKTESSTTTTFIPVSKSSGMFSDTKTSAFVPTTQSFGTSKPLGLSVDNISAPAISTKFGFSSTTSSLTTTTSNAFVFNTTSSQSNPTLSTSFLGKSSTIASSLNTAESSRTKDVVPGTRTGFSFNNTSNVFESKVPSSTGNTLFSFGSSSSTTNSMTSSQSASQSTVAKSMLSSQFNPKVESTMFSGFSNIASSKPETTPSKIVETSANALGTQSAVTPVTTTGLSFAVSNLIASPSKTESSGKFGSAANSTPQPGLFKNPVFGSMAPSTNLTSSLSIGQSSTITSTTDNISNPIFGGSAPTTSTSIPTFGKPNIMISTAAQSKPSNQSISGGTQSSSASTMSIFSTPAATTKQEVKSTTSIFQMSTVTPTATSSIFGGTVVPTTCGTAVTTAISAFALPATMSSVVSSNTNATSIFGSSGLSISVTGKSDTAPSLSLFKQPISSSTGASVSETQTTKGSLFSGTATATPSSTFLPASSIFGSTSNNKGSTNVFGAVTTSAIPLVTSSSIQTQESKPASIFGSSIPSTTTVTTTQASIFGSAVTTQSSIFGATNQASIFGSGTSGFGSATSSSVFGSSTSTPSTTSYQPTFASASSTSSPFSKQTESIFGAPKATSVFNQPSTVGNEGTFSSAPAKTNFGSTPFSSGSVFGTPTTSSGSIFGGAATGSSTFGTGFGTSSASGNIFGSPSTQSSTFGTPATTVAAFGFGSLSVNTTTSSSGNIFASPSFTQSATVNPFGKTDQKSTFGSGSASNIFGGAVSSSGSIFGANTPSSGTQSGFGSFSSPTFGQPTFGSSSFTSNQPGPFSGASSSPAAQTGFGSPNKTASGFGGPPIFGSPAPSFGGVPSFGGAPTFGSTATFGSPNKVFGEPSGGFGSTSTQPSAGFGSIATENTIGFGNLAQKAQSPNSAQFSGSSSFSSWR